MSNKELLPCPFCGKKPKIVITDDEGNLQDEDYAKNPYSGLWYSLAHYNKKCVIGIHDDSYYTGAYKTKAKAIKAWNARCFPLDNQENACDAFKPCKWFSDKIHSGMRIGNTYYSILKHQGNVHIYDATDKIHKLLLIVSNLKEANEWLKQKYNAEFNINLK